MKMDWEAMHALQAALSEDRSLQEQVQDWLGLQNLFREQLEQTESIFRPRREAYLKEFQNRLLKIGMYVKNHAKSA